MAPYTHYSLEMFKYTVLNYSAMLPKNNKARLLAISIAIVYFLFNVYAINSFLEVEKNWESSGVWLVDLFTVETEKFASYFFIIAVISAILAISFGFFVEVESVGTGLILGGLILLIYSGTRYWWFAGNKVRVVILAIALCVLVGTGYKLFGEKEAKSKKINKK